MSSTPCPKCRTILDTCQPDVARPYQFLATCPACGAWFRVEMRAGEPQGLLVSMPEIAALLSTQEPGPKHPA